MMTRSQLRAILVELQFLESMPDTLGLAFSIVLRSEAPPTSNRSPAPVRYYIGCAHLLKRELFLQLGAYDESFHCGEEPELSACVAQGLPSVPVPGRGDPS